MIVRKLMGQLGHGLVANVSAQSFALLVQLVVALVTIPVFAMLWGVEAFGVWLILFTLPAYIALTDFGLVGATASAMTAAAARGEENLAAAMFKQLAGSMFPLGLLVIGLAGAFATFGSHSQLAFAQDAAGGKAHIIVFALSCFAIFALWSRTLHAALRATGHFAKGAYCIALTALVEVALAAGFALAGWGLAGAALGYAMGQAGGLLAMLVIVRRYAPQFPPALFSSSLRHLRSLGGPALALVAMALGQAVLLQGTVMVLGLVAGAAAVPAFTAMRTLARLGVQSVAVVNQAVMPELTMARARSDTQRSADLVALNLTSALAIVVPGGILLGLFGPQIVDLWSGSVIEADSTLALVMAGVLAAGGLWGALAGFLTATNEQSRFAVMLLITSIVGLALALPLSEAIGASGAALAVLGVEVVMLGWTAHQAMRTGFFDAKAILAGPKRTVSIVRRWLASS